MRYVAIDVETTGLGERCGLLELAMVAEDRADHLASHRALDDARDVVCVLRRAYA